MLWRVHHQPPCSYESKPIAESALPLADPCLKSAPLSHLLHGSDNGCRKECQRAVFSLLSPGGLLSLFCLWLPLGFAIEEKVVSDLKKDTTHLYLCQHSLVCRSSAVSWVCLCHACLSSPRVQSTLSNVREAWESCLGRDRKGHPSLPWLLSSMTDTLWLSMTGQSQGPQGSFPEIQISTQQTSVCASKDYVIAHGHLKLHKVPEESSLLYWITLARTHARLFGCTKEVRKLFLKIYSYHSSVPSKPRHCTDCYAGEPGP